MGFPLSLVGDKIIICDSMAVLPEKEAGSANQQEGVRCAISSGPTGLQFTTCKNSCML